MNAAELFAAVFFGFVLGYYGASLYWVSHIKSQYEEFRERDRARLPEAERDSAKPGRPYQHTFDMRDRALRN
jgi:hypothetical protein